MYQLRFEAEDVEVQTRCRRDVGALARGGFIYLARISHTCGCGVVNQHSTGYTSTALFPNKRDACRCRSFPSGFRVMAQP